MTSGEEEFRHACEVRDLFDRSRFHSKEDLEEYFMGVSKKRGKTASNKLRNDYKIEFLYRYGFIYAENGRKK